MLHCHNSPHWIQLSDGVITARGTATWYDSTYLSGAGVLFPFSLETGWTTHWRVDIEGKGLYWFCCHGSRRILQRQVGDAIGWTREEIRLEPAGHVQLYRLWNQTELDEGVEGAITLINRPSDFWFTVSINDGHDAVAVGMTPNRWYSEEERVAI